MIVVPSASRNDIWIGIDGGGSFKPGSVINTKVSELRINLRVESIVARVVSPGAVDGVVILRNMSMERVVKEKIF
jgi:citrate lyase gamma subunit